MDYSMPQRKRNKVPETLLMFNALCCMLHVQYPITYTPVSKGLRFQNQFSTISFISLVASDFAIFEELALVALERQLRCQVPF